ncbi:hypothetical protein SEVIR_3G309300v4 [Setaria viridis]|uniref:Uncharacterized protein n=1 Tax=Setaria viridis TaxID=4556 RepID=A0A4V6DA52_SETVI|nr:hypothetical protein SEVIR_3G309300v2 [Setaria viridis]
MASTAAALNNVALVAAVCAVLLHSSMGQQPMPTPNCPDHTGQQPVPPPPSTPIPALTPMVDCQSYCSSQCQSNCTANMGADLAECDTTYARNFNGCYGECTNRTCPGKSCVHSGCGLGNCYCQNANARSCCEECSNILSSTYIECRYIIERAEPFCMMTCMSGCKQNCTQG